MDTNRFNELVKNARERQDKILFTKGADYTRHEADRLSNFKRSAAALGLDPLQVWAIFVNKHIDAVMAFVKTGKTESEAIEGRIDDVINYMYLGEALIVERRTVEEIQELKQLSHTENYPAGTPVTQDARQIFSEPQQRDYYTDETGKEDSRAVQHDPRAVQRARVARDSGRDVQNMNDKVWRDK